jgi:excisionase family DNA binding protein
MQSEPVDFLSESRMIDRPQTTTGELPTEAEFLTKREVAAMLRVSPRTLDTWLQRGLVPHIRLGRSVRFSRASLTRHLELQTIHAGGAR